MKTKKQTVYVERNGVLERQVLTVVVEEEEKGIQEDLKTANLVERARHARENKFVDLDEAEQQSHKTRLLEAFGVHVPKSVDEDIVARVANAVGGCNTAGH